jgi:hypothetical protein
VDTNIGYSRGQEEPFRAAEEPITTRELAHNVIAAKGLDPTDKVPARGIAVFQLVNALGVQNKRGNDAAVWMHVSGVHPYRSPLALT